jgi:transcription factor STE12
MHHNLSPLSISTVSTHDPSEYTPRPNSYPTLSKIEQDRLAYLDRLKFFLATAPSHWDNNNNNTTSSSSSSSQDPNHSNPNPHPLLNRFPLPSSEYVTCVLWCGLYHISGTDIVRALTFRFEAFGRPVRNVKKFEEGVFSDLRNLKPGVDACLEEPKVSLF